MRSPVFGRAFSVVTVLAVLVWWGVRVSSGVPAEPKGKFPAPAFDASLATRSGKETAILAGGCFWGIQGVFEHVKGVIRTTSGYTGGNVENPYYDLVSSGSTGHAESVELEYDPSQVSYGQLLMIFFSVAHDPTQKNRQGPDIGTQYRSAIFYRTAEQKKIAEAYIAEIDRAKVYDHPIATEVVAYTSFYPAEEYHQGYLDKHPENPYIRYNDLPKIAKLRTAYPELYR